MVFFELPRYLDTQEIHLLGKASSLAWQIGKQISIGEGLLQGVCCLTLFSLNGLVAFCGEVLLSCRYLRTTHINLISF